MVLELFREKNLYTVREEIYEIIPEDSSVIDIGCGSGRQLFLLSDKIKKGVGIDNSKRKINYAEYKKQEKGLENLEFYVRDIRKSENSLIKEGFDYAIINLVMHSLEYKNQMNLLQKSKNLSEKLIIADFNGLEDKKTRILISLDEMLAGHYKNFREYIQKEGVENLMKEAGYSSIQRRKTKSKAIDVWVL